MAILCFPKILSLDISSLNHKITVDSSYDLLLKKDTLFFPTLNIEENKVPLFFGLEIKWVVCGLFEF